MGDYWGIDAVSPELNDGRGTSVVLVNTEKGQAFLEKVRRAFKTLKKLPLKSALRGNPNITTPLAEHENRANFFSKDRKCFPWSTRHGYTLFSCCHGRTSALFRTDGPTVASPSCRGMSPLLQKPLPSPFLRDSPPTPSASPPRGGEAAPWSRRTGGRPAWPCVRGKAFCPCRRHDR